ncbi:hypothetical protein Y032_0126g1333 [Ancylostoma ceylanicum]|uniref:Uncharacterized protein n=1 Tax=Ancylostoma ceylanicum TaxID=53326 RepID=A0A016T8G2_9BILA|nr:hypothetical protein Y032_0126g1333 [Ancylostoma ceylanicum]
MKRIVNLVSKSQLKNVIFVKRRSEKYGNYEYPVHYGTFSQKEVMRDPISSSDEGNYTVVLKVSFRDTIVWESMSETIHVTEIEKIAIKNVRCDIVDNTVAASWEPTGIRKGDRVLYRVAVATKYAELKGFETNETTAVLFYLGVHHADIFRMTFQPVSVFRKIGNS